MGTTMSLTIPERTEARLREEAGRQGISVEELLERLIDGQPTGSDQDRKAPELPVWRSGVIGSLRRRDIYQDLA